jgi:N-acetylmuramoyl-L-alanine amidase
MRIKKSSRRISKIILHCTATHEGRESDVKEITRWHKARGFATIGYHYLVKLDGTVETGRSIHEPGAHTKGLNAHSIGVVYVGGLNKSGSKAKDTRTPEQDMALANLLSALMEMYPNATLHGHNEFANKACPSFDVQEEYAWLINPEEFIEEITIKEEEDEQE